MKRLKMASKIKLFLLFLILSAAPVAVNAQTHFDETDPDGGGVSDTPVNGGVVLLLIAGVGFGALQIYKVTKQSKLNKAA